MTPAQLIAQWTVLRPGKDSESAQKRFRLHPHRDWYNAHSGRSDCSINVQARPANALATHGDCLAEAVTTLLRPALRVIELNNMIPNVMSLGAEIGPELT
jgi:hypothetical protein